MTRDITEITFRSLMGPKTVSTRSERKALHAEIEKRFPQVAEWMADSRLPRSRYRDLELAILFAFDRGQEIALNRD